MSLEEQEEELSFGTGLILKDDIANSQRVVIKRLQGGVRLRGGILKRHTSIFLEQNAYFSNTREKSGILLSDAAVDEDEMLKKAITMSLEEETGARFAKGMMSTITFR